MKRKRRTIWKESLERIEQSKLKMRRQNKVEEEVRVHEEEVGRKYSRRGGRP